MGGQPAPVLAQRAASEALAGRAQLGPGQPPMCNFEIFRRDEVKR